MFFEKERGLVCVCLCVAAVYLYLFFCSSVLYFRASELSLSRRFVYLSLGLGFYVEYGERL